MPGLGTASRAGVGHSRRSHIHSVSVGATNSETGAWRRTSAPTERPGRVNGNGGGNLRKFLEVAYTEEGNELANAHEGDRNNALNRYGFSLGQLVHLGLKAGDIIEQAEWAASQWSWTHGRQDARKDRATIERAIQDGMQSPRKVAGHE